MATSRWSVESAPGVLGVRLGLRRHVRLVLDPPTRVWVRGPHRTLAIDVPHPSLLDALRVLADGDATATDLAEVVMRSGEEAFSDMLSNCLDHLSAHLMLRYRMHLGDGLDADLIPLSTEFAAAPLPESGSQRFVWSRFTLARMEGGAVIHESPTALARVEVWGRIGEVWCAGDPVGFTVATASELSDSSLDAEARLRAIWYSAGLLREVESEGTDGAGGGAAPFWEFHELLFHARSRAGRHADGYGARPKADETQPLTAEAAAPSGGIVLHRPTPNAATTRAGQLDRLLLERRSRREYGAVGVAAPELGDFLFRTARAVRRRLYDGSTGSHRLYPGGSGYALELYPLVNSCEGLESGLYHYEPDAHRLDLVARPSAETDRILEQARAAAAASQRPQVLFVITARFERVLPSYRSLGYSLVLKDVGVLLQTMYLVGEAMELATCALGGGDAELFGRAAGLDYYCESSVGEMALGSRSGRVPAPEPG